MDQLIFVIAMVLTSAMSAKAAKAYPWLPKDYTIPSRTISPDGRYGVMIPDGEGGGPSKIVELKVGRIVAELAGDYGWEKPHHSMRWGNMEAHWSADSSLLCWFFPGKWFPASYVLAKLHGGKLAWQIELMRAAQTEILARTEEAAPLNFAAAKLENTGNGSAYPEGFVIAISDQEPGFSIPFVCDVMLTSNSKASEDEPEENGVRAWLTMTVADDGHVGFSNFKVKEGVMTLEALQKVKMAATESDPLIDTDIGKALLFPKMNSEDGRYAVGWTVRPATKGMQPVDWSRWDAHDPDKLLRYYDWQSYGTDLSPKKPYEAVNFVIDRRSGKTLELPTELPYWPGKRMGDNMVTGWGSLPGDKAFGLIEIDDGLQGDGFWLVSIDEKEMRQKDLTRPMRKSVNGLLRERRPMVADPIDFMVSYDLDAARKAGISGGFATLPFEARYPVSNQREFGLHGSLTISLTDGTVTQISSDAKLLEPFVTKKELHEADAKLNALYQGLIKSLPAQAARALKIKQRAWIVKRDADADQAVNMMPYHQTSLNDLDKAEEVSKLRSPEMAVFSAGFRSTIPDCRLEKHCLPRWQCGRRWLA